MLIHVVKPRRYCLLHCPGYGIPCPSSSWTIAQTSSRLAGQGQALEVQFQPADHHGPARRNPTASIAAAYQLPTAPALPQSLTRRYPGSSIPGQNWCSPTTARRRMPLSVNGYAYPFIDPALSNPPSLTSPYLTPFTYGFTPDGTLVELDDEALLAAARQGGAAPSDAPVHPDRRGRLLQ